MVQMQNKAIKEKASKLAEKHRKSCEWSSLSLPHSSDNLRPAGPAKASIH